jgi:hypothetical protein
MQKVRAFLLLALSASALACYSPNPESGALMCSADQPQCPQGYYCLSASNTCWKKGQAPGDGGVGGDAGRPVDKFVGQWTFDSTGKLDETCTAMPTTSSSLSGDFVDVALGTSSDLIATYYCPWNLNLVASDRTKASIIAGQSCQTTSGTTPITMHGDAFDFQTADGASATMSASFTAVYVSGPALTCTFKVTGKLARMP